MREIIIPGEFVKFSRIIGFGILYVFQRGIVGGDAFDIGVRGEVKNKYSFEGLS